MSNSWQNFHNRKHAGDEDIDRGNSGRRDSKAPLYLSDNVDAESLSEKSDSPCPQIGAHEFDLDFQALSWVVAKWGSLSDESKRRAEDKPIPRTPRHRMLDAGAARRPRHPCSRVGRGTPSIAHTLDIPWKLGLTDSPHPERHRSRA